MEKSLWENLRGILYNYRGRLVKALSMVILSNVIAIFIPLVFRHAVMQMYPQEGIQEGTLGHILQFILGAHISSLWAWVVLLIFLAVIAAFFKYQMRFAFISISRDAERGVRSKVFSRIQEQSMAFYDRHGIGELLSRLTNDISAYRDVLGPGIMYPLYFLTLVIPGFFALFSISPILASVSIVPLLAIPVLNYAMKSAIYSASLKAQRGLADLSNMSQEHFSGVRIVKGYVAEHRLSAHI